MYGANMKTTEYILKKIKLCHSGWLYRTETLWNSIYRRTSNITTNASNVLGTIWKSSGTAVQLNHL